MRRSAAVGIAASAAVVLVLGGALTWWLTRTPTVEDAAASYLTALSSGDFATIAALLPGPSDDESHRILEEAFTSADSYISGARVEEITSVSGGTSVRASAMLNGEPREVRFVLNDSSGRWMLHGDHLAAVEAMTTLNGTDLPAGDSVWVGDVLAPAGTQLGLLPAVYTITAAPRELLAGSATAAVSNDHPADVSIDATIAPAAIASAQKQLDTYADECATPAATVPINCGLRVPWAADLTRLDQIAFRIEQKPTVVFGENGRTFGATGGVIVATASGASRTGAPASFTYRADDWSLRGSVSFRRNEMILAVG